MTYCPSCGEAFDDGDRFMDHINDEHETMSAIMPSGNTVVFPCERPACREEIEAVEGEQLRCPACGEQQIPPITASGDMTGDGEPVVVMHRR